MRDRCLLIVMTGMSLYAVRFIIFWAVALVPFWAQAVERAFPSGMFAWARRPKARSARPAWSMIGVGRRVSHRHRGPPRALPADRQ